MDHYVDKIIIPLNAFGRTCVDVRLKRHKDGSRTVIFKFN